MAALFKGQSTHIKNLLEPKDKTCPGRYITSSNIVIKTFTMMVLNHHFYTFQSQTMFQKTSILKNSF
ncbi:hypothetical protein SAMN05661099_2378 [Daejeonella lutea]|uniref:Uncharacterized protein n=1 Tax=Daejeonella lutea TaxID=572036 RepID=A0A1T5DJC0_9SPHI|nr:hypothetical protein SAMN05661099_2378 [Daejeonella lutea]